MTRQHRDPPLDPSLTEECQRALESWVCNDPITGDLESGELELRDAAAHLETCATCRDLADAIRLDQDLLRWQLSRIEPPPVPRLELRDPLRSASGHPRRVSLTLLPFLVGVILVLLLAVELMIGSIHTARTPSVPIELRTVRQIQQLERAALHVLTPPTSIGQPAPSDWAQRLWDGARGDLEGIRYDGGVLFDPFGGAFRCRTHPENLTWQVISAGKDGEFGDAGAPGDDLSTAENLSGE